MFYYASLRQRLCAHPQEHVLWYCMVEESIGSTLTNGAVTAPSCPQPCTFRTRALSRRFANLCFHVRVHAMFHCYRTSGFQERDSANFLHFQLTCQE